MKIDLRTHAKLLEFSREDSRPMGEIVADLVRRYERDRFWSQARADYARLQSEPQAWADYRAEQADWETLTADGLESEPSYFTADEERRIRERTIKRTPGR